MGRELSGLREYVEEASKSGVGWEPKIKPKSSGGRFRRSTQLPCYRQCPPPLRHRNLHEGKSGLPFLLTRDSLPSHLQDYGGDPLKCEMDSIETISNPFLQAGAVVSGGRAGRSMPTVGSLLSTRLDNIEAEICGFQTTASSRAPTLSPWLIPGSPTIRSGLQVGGLG